MSLLVRSSENLSKLIYSDINSRIRLMTSVLEKFYGIDDTAISLFHVLPIIAKEMQRYEYKPFQFYVYTHAFRDYEYSKSVIEQNQNSTWGLYCDDYRDIIKVGSTRDLEGRRSALKYEAQKQFPKYNLSFRETVVVFPCNRESVAKSLEMEIQESLDKYSIQGEWFHDCVGSGIILQMWWLFAKYLNEV